MKIAIGSDHRGLLLKQKIISFLRRKKMRVHDTGPLTADASDYPDFALKVAAMVSRKNARYGILICFSGQGMAMTANKVKSIRAAIAWKPEISRLARLHNDANILVLPAGFIRSARTWKNTVNAFLDTKFEGGRHRRRLGIIKKYESTH